MRNKLVNRKLYKLKIVKGINKTSAIENSAALQPPISLNQVRKSYVYRLNTDNFVSKFTSTLLNL